MSKANRPDPSAAATPSLNGAGFRRERERIAMGRKPLATRLGTPESRLTTVELRNQQVPAEWLGILAELGFRIPQEASDPSPSVANPPTEEVRAEPAPARPIGIDAAAPSVPAEPESEAVSATTTAVAESPISLRTTKPSKETDKNMTSSVGSKTQDAESPSETGSETDGVAFHGHWLRARRQQKGIRTADVAKQLGGPPADINTVERNNLRLPLVWIPSLLKLKLLTVAEAKAAMQMPSDKSSRMNGKWIREQRLQRKLKPADVASKLGTSRLDVELIETRNWLIPTEWFQPLAELFAASKSGKGKKPTQPEAPEAKKDSEPKQNVEPASVTAPEAKATPSDKAKPSPKPSAKAKGKAKPSDKAKGKASAKAKTSDKATPSPKPPAKSATNEPARAAKPEVAKPEVAKPAPTKSAAKKPDAKKPDAKKPSPSKSVETKPNGELTDAVVRYRMMLGERAGLSAVEVLAQIAADLQLTLGKDALSYERLRTAMRALTGQ